MSSSLEPRSSSSVEVLVLNGILRKLGNDSVKKCGGEGWERGYPRERAAADLLCALQQPRGPCSLGPDGAER